MPGRECADETCSAWICPDSESIQSRCCQTAKGVVELGLRGSRYFQRNSGRFQRFPKSFYSSLNVLANLTYGHIELDGPEACDGFFNAFNLAIQFSQSLCEHIDVPCGFYGFDQFPLPPLPKLAFTACDQLIEPFRIQDSLLDGIEKLLLKPILTDHQLIAAHTAVLVRVASIRILACRRPHK